MNMKQVLRKNAIEQLVGLLKRYKNDITKERKEKILMTIIVKHNLARRTAQEYLKAAEMQVSMDNE